MAIEKLAIEQFLKLARDHPTFDVRSPGEFSHAHIPGAFNLPLFSDDQRKIVGTAYKQQSREAAIKIGLDFFGLKMKDMIERVEALTRQQPKKNDQLNQQLEASPKKTVLVHCWRGGMRSAGVAWLLDLYGFRVFTLAGGYKQFRQYVLQTFEQNHRLMILGGYTGSGKTMILHQLAKRGAPVIDLEGLARHKGSAFGAMDGAPQPSQEMFENTLALELTEKTAAYGQQAVPAPIWLEDESQRIGLINLPASFWNTMRRSQIVFVEIPFEQRLAHIVEEYGKMDREKISASISRIQKRLGGLETKTALGLLHENQLEACFRILLNYYDKCYGKSLQERQDKENKLLRLDCPSTDAALNAKQIMNFKMIAT